MRGLRKNYASFTLNDISFDVPSGYIMGFIRPNGAVGIIISGNFGFIMGTGEILLAGFLLAAVFVVIQALQLPFFFKMGYTKAKFFSLVPFVTLMTGYFVFMSSSKDNGFINRIEDALERLTGGALISLAVPALYLVCYCSYRLSLLFYKKREF